MKVIWGEKTDLFLLNIFKGTVCSFWRDLVAEMKYYIKNIKFQLVVICTITTRWRRANGCLSQ